MDVQTFWDNKILNWEQARYNAALKPGQIAVGKPGGRFLIGRLRQTLDLLRPFVRNASALDLGCGSGILALHLLDAGAGFVHGIDISGRAIEKAKERAAQAGYVGKVFFESKRIEELQSIQEDVVVALGLTDWLSDEQMRQLFGLIGEKPFVVSFSENRLDLMRYLHSLYTYLLYGWKTRGYVPRYYRESQMRSYLAPSAGARVRVLRSKEMGFGALLTNVAW